MKKWALQDFFEQENLVITLMYEWNQSSFTYPLFVVLCWHEVYFYFERIAANMEFYET